jgi:hypothetical protein
VSAIFLYLSGLAGTNLRPLLKQGEKMVAIAVAIFLHKFAPNHARRFKPAATIEKDDGAAFGLHEQHFLILFSSPP